MASGQFLDPMALLRVAPLISTTSTLWFACDQHVFFSLFCRPSLRKEANAILPKYWRAFFPSDLPRLLAPLFVTTISAVVNLRKSGPLLRTKGSWGYYAAAAALAMGHLCFVPLVMYKIQAITEDWRKGNAVEDQKHWLFWHDIRSSTVDLAAWLCSLVAVVKTLSP